MYLNLVLALLVSVSASASTPSPPGSVGSGDVPKPVVLAGSRSISTRNNAGVLTRDTMIPTTSAFSKYAGGPRATCTATATRDDFQLSDGTTVPKGTEIVGAFVFVEGLANPMDYPPLADPAAPPASKGPLEAAFRTFSVYCDRAYDTSLISVIQVPLLDPYLNPRSQIDKLRNLLQLDQPEVFTNPIVDQYGGLVTRYPTWLAIQPTAWHTQQSPPIIYRGTTLRLIAAPRDLDFSVVYAPKHGIETEPSLDAVACVPDLEPTPDGRALPALPALPDQTRPGPNGPCMWTPPGPGVATVTATITYTITFWADGYTESAEEYAWSSEPTSYTTGELIAVNTKP